MKLALAVNAIIILPTSVAAWGFSHGTEVTENRSEEKGTDRSGVG